MDAPRAPLTAVEQNLWRFLLDHLASHGYQPSIREIARHLRIPSTRTVSDLLKALERKGYLRRAPGRSRGVILEGVGGQAGTQPVPVVHWTADGAMLTEEHLSLDRALLVSDDCFLIRANVEDAPRHAVREGDLLLVAPTARTPEGAPVVVRVGRQVYVRQLERRGSSVRLMAPAPGSQDLIVGEDAVRILGPLAAVFRVTLAPATADDLT